MENKTINISCFDINGEYLDEEPQDQSKNFLNLESPSRIISQYITENFLQNLSKSETDDKFVTKFTFSQNIEKKILITINCDVINNFSVSHQGTFDSNGYIIFCNLSKKNTFELMEKMFNYISDNCSIFIKTYVIGVFSDKIDEDKKYEKMKEFFKNLDTEIDFDYYEMYLGDTNKFDEIKKNNENAQNMGDILKNIFEEICKNDGLPSINRKVDLKNGVNDRSKMGCKIF